MLEEVLGVSGLPGDFEAFFLILRLNLSSANGLR